jgi:hypothetical protein
MLTVIRLNFRFDFDKVAIMHATLQRYYGFNCEQHNHNTVTTETALKLDAYITEVVDCAHHIAFKSKKSTFDHSIITFPMFSDMFWVSWQDPGTLLTAKYK